MRTLVLLVLLASFLALANTASSGVRTNDKVPAEASYGDCSG